VNPRRHVGPFLGPCPRLPLKHQVACDLQPPRPEQQDEGCPEQDKPAKRLQGSHALVGGEQPADPAGEQDPHQAQPGRGAAPVGAGSEAAQRRCPPAQRGLLAVGRIAPDQHQARHADDQWPSPGPDDRVVQHLGQQHDDCQQRRDGSGERDPPRVVPCPAPDAGHGLTRPGSRDQQPGQDVDRDQLARAQQGHDDNRDPHAGGAEAAPPRQSGRDPARQPVAAIPAQRSPVPPALPAPCPGRDPLGQVWRPPGGTLRWPAAFLHASIITCPGRHVHQGRPRHNPEKDSSGRRAKDPAPSPPGICPGPDQGTSRCAGPGGCRTVEA
jgi:hypothetical protein